MQTLIDAIRIAPTKHAVYFLLTSYIAARGCDDARSDLPGEVKALPIGIVDLNERLRAVRETRDVHVKRGPRVPTIVQEAVAVLSAASQQLKRLESSDRPEKTWNLVERSQHGTERRRRLGWRMTEREAADWAAANGTQVERVENTPL